MLHIVMDGSGDMPADWAKTYDIQTVPINIHIGDQTFQQGVDLSDEDFYRYVEEMRAIPKTATPSPQQFIDVFRRIAQAGDTILSINLSSKLSGTFASAKLAAQALEGEVPVVAFDSWSGSAGLAFLCREARNLDRQGTPLQGILDQLDSIRRSMHIMFVLDTLEYARLSGRVKALQAAVVSLLNIKPIISVKEGAMLLADRVRSQQRALTYIVDAMRARFGEQPVNVAVVNARAPELGQALLERVRQSLNCTDAIATSLSISVAAHLGPGTVGVVAYPASGK
jgi:DegV family protein with EDD domain